jgi:anaphase-promoting complex subunit 1
MATDAVGENEGTVVAKFNNDRRSLHTTTSHGTENASLVTQRRFALDCRMEEAAQLLDASIPTWVVVAPVAGMTDHDHLAEQKNHLLAIGLRTMALSVGRGMLALQTVRPVVTQTVHVPKLELSGRAHPTGAPVSLDDALLPEDARRWPLYHNGVAASLRLIRRSERASSTAWIAYHEANTRHLEDEMAGFLFGLGLTGHLEDLGSVKLHVYLSQGHETTSVALLLGLATCKRATCDDDIARVLSIHIPALLPATSAEVDVTNLMQASAMIGMGMVFQGSGTRRLVEVMLAEIGKPPPSTFTGDMNRESLALCAGIALGLVLLSKV